MACIVALVMIPTCTPFISEEFLIISAETCRKCDTCSHTEIDILDAYLAYYIYPDGEYRCYFRLEALGNWLTEHNFAQCSFSLSGLTFDEVTISIQNDPIVVNKTGNIVTFSTINHTIHSGDSFLIRGSYWGKYSRNTSDTYSYELGIDWGTKVVTHNTEIRFGSDYTYESIIPEPTTIVSNSGNIVLAWTNINLEGFNATLELHPRELPNTFLMIDFPPWNCTIGETIHVPIENIGDFDVELFIITPDWISTNVSNYTLIPEEKIVATFLVNSLASPRMNGCIQVIVYELQEPIIIPVVVLDKPPDGLFPVIIIFSCFAVFFAIGFFYYRHDAVMNFLSRGKLRKDISAQNASTSSNSHLDFSKAVDLNWDSIQARWESILPRQELQVVEILFFQGALNQKSIAEQLSVSEMNMSRIISRLENKRLLIRERLGMSNMIKLNRRKL